MREPTEWRELAREDSWLLLAALGLGAITLYLYPDLPDVVPIHWNWRGEADGFASKLTGCSVLPGTLAMVWALMWSMPGRDPRRDNFHTYRESYRSVRQLTVVMLLCVHALLLTTWSGVEIAMDTAATILTGVLFAGIGNVFGRVRPNHYFGYRCRWTLSDDWVWRQTHRFAAPLWFVGGISMCLSTLLPPIIRIFTMSMIVCVLGIAPYARAYQLHRRR